MHVILCGMQKTERVTGLAVCTLRPAALCSWCHSLTWFSSLLFNYTIQQLITQLIRICPVGTMNISEIWGNPSNIWGDMSANKATFSSQRQAVSMTSIYYAFMQIILLLFDQVQRYFCLQLSTMEFSKNVICGTCSINLFHLLISAEQTCLFFLKKTKPWSVSKTSQ